MGSKTYSITEEMFMMIRQTLVPFVPNVEGIDKLIGRMDAFKKEQDASPPVLRGGLVEIKEVLDSMFALMYDKGQDYSDRTNTFESFETSADFAGVHPDISFRILFGVKIARLRNLHKKHSYEIRNESLEDSYMDLANYLVLFLAYQKFLANLEKKI